MQNEAIRSNERTRAQVQKVIKIVLVNGVKKSALGIGTISSVMTTHKSVPIIKGTQAPKGTFRRAAPQNKPSKNTKTTKKEMARIMGIFFTQ
jgi:hypothetical protein